MADYIERKGTLKKAQIFQQYNSAIKDDEYIRAVTVADIEAMPSIDAVEVVRCKDCKRCGQDKALYYCRKLQMYVDGTDFCKWGEKNET